MPEALYNQADLLATRGELEPALAGFGYVVEIDPDFTDAYVNRATLPLADLDAADPADPDVAGQRARILAPVERSEMSA
jgi:hypothetical protein